MTCLVTQNYNFREWEVWGGQNGKYLNPTGLIYIEKREKSKKVQVGRGKMEIFEGGRAKLGKS